MIHDHSDSANRVSCRNVPWVLCVALVGLGLGAEAARAQAADSGVTAAVEAREIAFAATMADRDVEAFRSFLADDAVFFGPAGPIRGRDAVVEAWSAYFEAPDAPFSWHPDQVEVSGTIAFSSGPVRDPAGNQVGRFNSTWRLEADGVWRVVFDKGCP